MSRTSRAVLVSATAVVITIASTAALLPSADAYTCRANARWCGARWTPSATATPTPSASSTPASAQVTTPTATPTATTSSTPKATASATASSTPSSTTVPVSTSAPSSTPSSATTYCRPVTTSSTIATPLGSGAYVGPGTPSTMASFSSWRGCATPFAMDFLPMDSWSAMDNPSWLLNAWHSTGTPLALGVPMLTNDTSTTLATGATGAYDGYYKTLAQNLVSHGYQNAALRVGWEMNAGNAFRWTAATNPTAWTTYYKRIVDSMRSVPGQSFKFDWNINLGSASAKPDAIYPGDAYVDYIGVDIYDWKWQDSSISPSARWSWMLTQSYGLNWVASFAAAHGKRITVPEWGLAPTADNSGGGGGDDAYYITAMINWVRTHDVAYEAYFNYLDHKVWGGPFPNAAAAYQAAMRS